ncbi:MAG: hypothetical protein HY818_17705 [Acetobacterium woodii]|nr:hypothetical protein [Acetobacterium woodii]
MERTVLLGALLTIYTIWLVVDLIKSKGKSMTKIMRRAAIFFAIAGWFMYLLYIGSPIIGGMNNSAFKIAISLGFLVMMGLFIAPHVHIEKGTPTYELIKGALIMVVVSIIALIILVSLGPDYINSL